MVGFMQFKFKMVQKDKQRYLNSCDKLMDRLLINKDKMENMQAEALKQLLIGNITGQKFSYVSHNERYKAWKDTYGDSRFWILYGDLLKAIQVGEIQRWGRPHKFVGIKPKIFDRGGKSWLGHGDKGEPKEILVYALVMEKGGNYKSKGGGDHPARPMFQPTEEEFSQSGIRMRIYNQGAINVLGAWR